MLAALLLNNQVRSPFVRGGDDKPRRRPDEYSAHELQAAAEARIRATVLRQFETIKIRKRSELDALAILIALGEL